MFGLGIMDFETTSAVRVLCGAFLLPHTIAKLRNIDRASEFFAKAGFYPPRAFVVFTALMEAVAAASLIFAIFPRLGALLAATILFVAAGAQAKVHGLQWRWQLGGIEYMLFWGFVCLAVGLLP